ncbi:NADPH-dependent FMN reductase [Cordyceps fumosorosea ARSEF 2679]|uniref:NADPH-dependent FMN reductase n=1 Tax=Cordyceps fumosorosea (strain ARSEF 2679) TaxID=1081104 RepID=A0A167SW36_CORFA|nr:NADPH-dependent FMN reductase [Cordyceps fumosorosea ARSEF 2679]OAA59986.1 NADPH-dependent FMN reductase [Cordyceps fumosorosea ARSEF 2679]
MTAKAPRIGIVTCSTRSTRVNPLITQHIHDLLATSIIRSVPGLASATLHVIDLEAQGLPLFDEPAIPASLPTTDPTPHYLQPHTRRWSAAVRAHDAFVFVTPQYNWSVPASLKNALDYLYHEWAGKPAAVVTYGSRGGGRAATHLREILAGLKMAVAGTAVPLKIGVDDVSECLAEGALSDAVVRRWEEAGVEETLRSAVTEMGEKE